MSKAQQRRWTPKEDAILRECVGAQSASLENRTINWNEIAKRIPGRSNKDCRKRFCNEVTGGLKKGPWTAEEDAKLKGFVQEVGMSWALIAQKMENRSADQCSKRWQHCLDPALDRRPWVEDENHILLAAVATHGSSWKDIQTIHFPTRSANNVKNQYTILTRKSAEMPPGMPPCCPDLVSRPTSSQSKHSTQKHASTFRNDSMNLEADLGFEASSSSSAHAAQQTCMDDSLYNNDMDFYRFLDDVSTSDFSLEASEYGGSGLTTATTLSPPEFDLDFLDGSVADAGSPYGLDLTAAGGAGGGLGAGGAFHVTSRPDSDCPWEAHTRTESMDIDSVTRGLDHAEPSYRPGSACAGQRQQQQQQQSTDAQCWKSNGQITITLDDAEMGTVMEVMNILVQSKAKVKFETT